MHRDTACQSRRCGGRGGGDDPQPVQPELPRRRRGACDRRVDQARAGRPDQHPVCSIHRQHASRNRAIVEVRGVAHGDSAAAERRSRAPRQPGSRRAVGNGHEALGPLRRERQPHESRVDVHAVANHLGRNRLVLEDGAGEARRPMAHRRHAIEEVRRLPRAGFDSCDRLLVARARVTERDSKSRADEIGDEIDRAVEPRTTVTIPTPAGSGDLAKNVGARKRPVRRGPSWRAQTVEWLRAAEFGVDEIALEVRRQNASARHCGCPCLANRRKHPAQRVWIAGDGGRTERGHAVARQRTRDSIDGVVASERIETVDAVHVHVDEARHHGPSGEIDRHVGGAAGARTRQDVDDAIAVDRDRPRAEDAVGKNDVCAGEENHALDA